MVDVARAAGRAGYDYGVTVIVTVPTAFISPLVQLKTGVLVFGQELSADGIGPTFGTVTAEALEDVAADGVMLNHDSNPLSADALADAVRRTAETGLLSIVCAGTEREALESAALNPSVILFEPPDLIGTSGGHTRAWIPSSNTAVKDAHPRVLMMHAGGVSSPDIARSIMAAGADGTGSTSGVLSSDDPASAARRFIAEARTGWDDAR
ncbi:triose-phosphate isomerase [Frigoribacterium sp. PhB24]|uniref:triose-phosphate isomerase n=1 Tax=Frigoribacterium sp. PhB24 TaxID=2485204 RepID=UPI000F47D5AE|nr:triose-phosphate isomerase [Frigoribacterium sp. PhB24]